VIQFSRPKYNPESRLQPKDCKRLSCFSQSPYFKQLIHGICCPACRPFFLCQPRAGHRKSANIPRIRSHNRTPRTTQGNITDGFGQEPARCKASTHGFIHTRSEYNVKGQLTKQYQDTGSPATAAALYECGSFGNVTKQPFALSDTPTVENSPIVEFSYGVETTDDGIYSVTASTRYNAEGTALTNSSFPSCLQHWKTNGDPPMKEA